jgi:hypothetical protein
VTFSVSTPSITSLDNISTTNIEVSTYFRVLDGELLIEGKDDGCSETEGFNVGSTEYDGDVDGTLEGDSDGIRDGIKDGNVVGYDVGDRDGIIEGYELVDGE